MLLLIASLSKRGRVLAATACGLGLLLGASQLAASPREDKTDPATPVLTLRKCVTPGGAIAFQSALCNDTAREVWSRQEVLEVPRPAAKKTAVARDSSRSRVATAQRGGQARGGRRQRCDAARQEAAAKRDRDWNRLKFDDLSRLDAWVAERCR